MKMRNRKRVRYLLSAALLTGSVFFANVEADAQTQGGGRGNATSGAGASGTAASSGGGGQAAAARIRAESRLQNRIQQRAQQQVQQAVQNRAQAATQTRMQARVQDRVQSRLEERFKGRPKEQVSQAIRTAERANDVLERVTLGPDERRQHPGSERAQGNASLATRQAIADQYPDGFSLENLTEEDLAKLPKGFQKANEAALEAVFGRFANFLPQEPQTSDQPAVGNERLRRGNNREADLENRIQVAARHRRAEIASMRDQALDTGDVSMMTRADQSEMNLEAFLESRQQANRARLAELPSPQ